LKHKYGTNVLKWSSYCQLGWGQTHYDERQLHEIVVMSSMSLYLVLNSSNKRHSWYLLGRFYSGGYALLEPLLCLKYMESSLYHQFFLGKKKVRHSFESRQTKESFP